MEHFDNYTEFTSSDFPAADEKGRIKYEMKEIQEFLEQKESSERHFLPRIQDEQLKRSFNRKMKRENQELSEQLQNVFDNASANSSTLMDTIETTSPIDGEVYISKLKLFSENERKQEISLLYP